MSGSSDGKPEREKRKSSDQSDAANKRQQSAGNAPNTSLVFCASGVYGDDLQALQGACERLGARLVNEWSDDVTHLVMSKITWTPKFLHALAGLVAVVSPLWVQRAAELSPGALPDPCDAALEPKAGGSSAGVAAVRPERASLFRGKRFICLPGVPEDTSALLQKMGGEVQSWPAEAPELGEFVAARADEGFGFVLPGDEKWPSSVEAKAAIGAGAEVISPLLVRTSLIMARFCSARHLQTGSASAGGPSAALVRSGET